MAKVSGQSVPPSLHEAYDALLYTSKGAQRPGTRVSVQPSARAPEPADPGSPLAKLAASAAAWLRDQWVPDTDPRARSTFYRDRKEEILAGEFPAAYWYASTIISDMTELGYPYVTPWAGDWNPAYWDPLRQPSLCEYHEIANTYATPPPPGTQQQPAPGWAGSVHGVQWQDDWAARRKTVLSLPISITKGDPRPAIIKAAITITATATRRGNRSWFNVCIRPTYWHNYGWEPSPPYLFMLWQPSEQYPYPLASAAPSGWEQSFTRTLCSDGHANAKWIHNTDCNRAAIRIHTPPSLGRYSSGNDAVSVYHYGDVALYIAKGPHG